MKAAGTVLIAILVSLTAIACSKDMPIVEPTYSQISKDTVRVELKFEVDDAEFIKSKEIYLTFTAHECESGAKRYPAEAFVGESNVSDFTFPIVGERILSHADIPVDVFSRYERPCLALEGGGYAGRSLSSESTPIEPKIR